MHEINTCHDYITEVTDNGYRHDLQDDPFEMSEKLTVVYKLMYVSLSISFEYEREEYPYRVNGGFKGDSATWPRNSASA